MILFAGLLIAWIAIEAALTSPDRPVPGTLAGATAAILFASHVAGVVEHLATARTWSPALGAILFAAGIALRAWSIATLRDAFASTLASPVLITRGPYRWLHHPSELGLILATLGAALILASYAILVALAALVPISLVRCRREDRALAPLTRRVNRSIK